MKKSKSIYSALDIEVLPEEQLAALKRTCLKVLIDIANVCDENNIKYMLAYGTLLGAVRHKGFIPWDDDIDIYVDRRDVFLLRKKIREKYGRKYKFLELKRRPADFYNIELVGTEARQFSADNDEIVTGVKIDLFPLDFVSSNHFIARLQDLVDLVATTSNSLRRDFKHPSKIIMETNDKWLKKYYKKRRMIGAITSIFPERFYEKFFLRFGISHKDTGVIRADTNCFVPAEMFEKTTDLEFEGHMFKCPAKYDEYLRLIFGDDYMEIPPESKREIHSYVNLDLGRYE